MRGRRLPARARVRPRHRAGEMNNTEKAFLRWIVDHTASGVDSVVVRPGEPSHLTGLPVPEGSLGWDEHIVAHWFESFKFRLADNTFYTPDFVVQWNTGELVAYEVKASWTKRNKQTGEVSTRVAWEDDARVKIKVAAEAYPIRFVGASPIDRDMTRWTFERFDG